MRIAPLLFVAALALPCAAQSAPPSYKTAKQELERVFREEPEALDKLDAALKAVMEVSEDTPKAEIEDLKKLIARRRRDVEAILDSLQQLRTAQADFQQDKDAGKASARWSKALAEVRSVTWVGKRQEEWFELTLHLLKDLVQESGELKAAATPDWAKIGMSLRLATSVSAALPPEQFHPADAQALSRDAEEAIGKMYFETKWPEALPWRDMLDEKTPWKSDDGIKVEKQDGARTLANLSEAPGLVWLNEQVEWQDYTIRMEATVHTDAAFQLLQRITASTTPAATHDAVAVLSQGGFKVGERVTFEFTIYGSKCRASVGGKVARPFRCAPSGARAGGFCFRLPHGAKITIHKLEVRVLLEKQ
ncbi:MAG: hypothetical protein K8T20_08305 [Planctomycetes bacterium]|nr:hypothetical protein [Planctomycetota bacterium]